MWVHICTWEQARLTDTTVGWWGQLMTPTPGALVSLPLFRCDTLIDSVRKFPNKAEGCEKQDHNGEVLVTYLFKAKGTQNT